MQATVAGNVFNHRMYLIREIGNTAIMLRPADRKLPARRSEATEEIMAETRICQIGEFQ